MLYQHLSTEVALRGVRIAHVVESGELLDVPIKVLQYTIENFNPNMTRVARRRPEF